jgi:hypothetical protein
LRAIDDEASLALSFGTLANLLSARLMLTLALLVLALASLEGMRSLLYKAGYVDITSGFGSYPDFFIALPFLLVILGVIFLVAFVSRGVFGRELIFHPPGIQMNVQSVPDFIRSAEIRTLLRADETFFSLRHGIHSHPNASLVVADWICAERPMARKSEIRQSTF